MAYFVDPTLQALLESERRGQRKAREVRPLRAGAAPLEGPVARRVYGANRFPKQCASMDCTRRGYIPAGEGVLTKSPSGEWEVLHTSCNGG